MDFESFSIDNLIDETSQALSFHISATGYLEEVSLCFTNVIDLDLTVKPAAIVDNPSQVVTNFKEEMIKKKNKCAAKKKERLIKVCALVGSS